MLSDSTISLIRQFTRERNWDQFDTPENLAKCISIEAAELLECYQWSNAPRDNDINHVQEELSDVLIYCIMLAEKLNCDLDEIVRDKMAKNRQKYPVAKAYGNSGKYRNL